MGLSTLQTVRAAATAVLAGSMLASSVAAAPYPARDSDPFAILDPQNIVLPDNMTWADYVKPPGTNWSDPSKKGSERNFNIALVVVDYPDRPFVITQAPGSTPFKNPQPIVSGLSRDEVPAFYRDFLNKPSDLNRMHTLHEYWMEDSGGRYGVDLTVFGAYEMPSLSYQYGVDDETGGFNPDACPSAGPCSVDLRTDALGAWRAEVGNATASSYELVFILSAGQDESSTWQEFGEMKFQTPEDVPAEFGPPDDSIPNWAHTRYVNWTSWASASVIWPNAGGGSSTQAESSGMGTYAHELSHLLGIGDNYNNPYGVPARRDYAGPFSMLSRGTFNGPGGPHTRWQIPAQLGGSLGSPHTMGDKLRIDLVDAGRVLMVSRAALAGSGLVMAEITARVVSPTGPQLMGLHIVLPTDLSPACNARTDPFCDGGGYHSYDVEVIDRMGADSFQPDHGVMISKTKNQTSSAPFQWVIDANPQDIDVVDFYRPDGTPSKLTVGDYRQLADALFHAGTRSGSEFEFVDAANRLHFYVLSTRRDAAGVLSYTVAVRSLDGSGKSVHGVRLGAGAVVARPGGGAAKATEGGVTCTFRLSNAGRYVDGRAAHPQDLAAHLGADVYRLAAEVDAPGWRVALPNALVAARYGGAPAAVDVAVAAAAGKGARASAVVTLTASSESDPRVSATAKCHVKKG
ncbi:putative m6 family metalloprotease domain-containing protein [Rosellinia necatrix]|uniref:Putative m6 family metalloprotease domain-containing protein n=1 Tax=Rosellinia necatrix TaxID=77044 RepID=A0A1S7UNS4_ROSNE|nr:putative m6 family metalloprotease domain-containing protein [Rosellinia necatrix]